MANTLHDQPNATMHRHTAQARGTVYRLTVVDDDGEDWLLLFESGHSSSAGEWVKIPAYMVGGPLVAWNYLTEKCPALARYNGDRDGWVTVLRLAGVKVFNT